jgi:hypothetical protein
MQSQEHSTGHDAETAILRLTPLVNDPFQYYSEHTAVSTNEILYRTSQSSQAIEYGSESRGRSNPESLCWRGPASTYPTDRPKTAVTQIPWGLADLNIFIVFKI